MKRSILLLALVFISGAMYAQKKTTTSASVTFDATTPLDAMPKAENKTGVAALNPKTGELAFEVIIKSFSFGNPMMQEHFNGAKWMNSDEFPKATFKGKITNINEVNFNKDGTYPAEITGDLTIHGITKPLVAKGTVMVKEKAISATSDFSVKLEDYGINSNTGGKVSKEPKISIAVDFK